MSERNEEPSLYSKHRVYLKNEYIDILASLYEPEDGKSFSLSWCLTDLLRSAALNAQLKAEFARLN